MYRKKNIIIFCILGALCMCVTLFGLLKDADMYRNVAKVDKMIQWNNGWRYEQDKGQGEIETLPVTVFSQHKTVVVQNILPKTIGENAILVLKNQYQDIQVFVEEELRYTYFGRIDLEQRYKEANFYCVVDLEQKDEGKPLRVAITPVGNTVVVPEFQWGAASAFILGLYQENIDTVIFSCLMFFTGVCMIGLYFYQRGMEAKTRKLFIYLGILMFACGIWIFMESSLVQVYFEEVSLPFFISTNLLLLMPLPILIFLSLLMERQTKLFEILGVVIGIHFFIQNLFYLLNIYSFAQMRVVTQCIYVVMLLAVSVVLFQENRQQRRETTQCIFAGGLIFLGCVLLDMVGLTEARHGAEMTYFRYGIILLILMMLWLSVRRILGYLAIEVESRVYKKMAFFDTLTKLPNRNAMEKCIEDMEKSKKRYERMTVVLLDVNGLKPVNDTLGHSAGDCLLEKAARCIQEAFPEARNRCYRLGGDEFLVILTEVILTELECRERLKGATCIWEEEGAISISCGCSTQEGQWVTREEMGRLMGEADLRMYAHKQQHYENLTDVGKSPTS